MPAMGFLMLELRPTALSKQKSPPRSCRTIAGCIAYGTVSLRWTVRRWPDKPGTILKRS